MLREILGKKIRQLRKKARLTQKELGIKADMEYQYLGAIERGEKNPSLDFIEKIANGLELKPYQLFMFEEEQKINKKIIADEILEFIGECDIKTSELIRDIIKIVCKS